MSFFLVISLANCLQQRCPRFLAWISLRLFTWSMLSKVFFMHLMATCLPDLSKIDRRIVAFIALRNCSNFSFMIWYKYIYILYMFLKLFRPSVGFPNKSCCGYWVFAALGYPLPTLTYLVRPSGIPAPSIKNKHDRIFGNASQCPTRCSMGHQVDQVLQVESAWDLTNIWFLV